MCNINNTKLLYYLNVANCFRRGYMVHVIKISDNSFEHEREKILARLVELATLARDIRLQEVFNNPKTAKL
jgi:hypothetical protein